MLLKEGEKHACHYAMESINGIKTLTFALKWKYLQACSEPMIIQFRAFLRHSEKLEERSILLNGGQNNWTHSVVKTDH